jgi:Ca2+-binding RTX toxin-like protein
MKKFFTAAVTAATVVGLVGLVSIAPAQAATRQCQGNNVTKTFTTSATKFSFKGTNGNDVIAIVGGTQASPTTIYAGAGNDYICNFSSNTVIVFGEYGDDIFDAQKANSIFFGGDWGADYGVGGTGNDKFYGGPYADHLYGGGGLNYISGGAGNDILIGGPASDVMIGGAGDKDYVSPQDFGSVDSVADVVYASKSEQVNIGKGDAAYPTAAQLTAHDASIKASMLSVYKDKKKYKIVVAKISNGGVMRETVSVTRISNGALIDWWIAS